MQLQTKAVQFPVIAQCTGCKQTEWRPGLQRRAHSKFRREIYKLEHYKKYQQLLKLWNTWAKQDNYSEDIKSYQPENDNFGLQVDDQYSNAISAAKSNRSQIQTHVSKQVYFNPFQQMSNLMEDKIQSFESNHCHASYLHYSTWLAARPVTL